jgi:hypothetical protein
MRAVRFCMSFSFKMFARTALFDEKENGIWLVRWG